MPLFITACGVVVSFRSGYFNVGAQGQFYIGAIGATFVVDFLNGYPAALVCAARLRHGDRVRRALGGLAWLSPRGVGRRRSDHHADGQLHRFAHSHLCDGRNFEGPVGDRPGYGKSPRRRSLPDQLRGWPVAGHRRSRRCGGRPHLGSRQSHRFWRSLRPGGTKSYDGRLARRSDVAIRSRSLCALRGPCRSCRRCRGAGSERQARQRLSADARLHCDPDCARRGAFGHGRRRSSRCSSADLPRRASICLCWPAFPPPRSTSSTRRSRSSSPLEPRLDWRGFCRGDAPRGGA